MYKHLHRLEHIQNLLALLRFVFVYGVEVAAVALEEEVRQHLAAKEELVAGEVQEQAFNFPQRV
jgi:hypothetical protein